MKTFLALALMAMLAGCGPSPGTNGDLATLQRDLAELQAREQIRALFTDYGRTLDNRDFAAFGALYARDGEYIAGGAAGTARGPAEIADLLEGLITENAIGANLHVYSNESITVHDDLQSASASSRGAFYVQDGAGQPIPLMFATYNDELVLEEGRWKFKQRQVLGDIPGPSNEERAGIALPDLGGDWVIASSVGGRIPITVYCSMQQRGSVLSGNCTPEMENPEASTIRGTVGLKRAMWGYDVVFNGNPGRIDFTATTLSNEMLEGSLSLSGTVAPFTATRGVRP
jgi:hypothetical protein